jgi:hypothetical protein
MQEIESVEAECLLLRQELSSLPLLMISELTEHSILQDFTHIIALYNKNNGRPSVTRFWDRQVHQKLCENILRSVLFPCIPICNLRNVNSEFVEELLIKLMYFTPNTEILIMPEVEYINYRQHLVKNIQILNRLQEFNFHFGCTTNIIVELSKYCPRLKNISVQYSIFVCNNCVEDLLKLRHLQNLNVAGTSVSNSGYRALISGLPELQDIVWFNPIEQVLRHTTGDFHSVTRFIGNVSSANLVVHKCPNINELTLLRIDEIVPSLGELRSVSKLAIISSSCIEMGFSMFIRQVGANLTTLEMNQVWDINVNDIVNYCCALNSLDLKHCRTMDIGVGDRNSVHFRNLRILKFVINMGVFGFGSILYLYYNLNEFHAAHVRVVTETLIRQIVTHGGFRHLNKFVVKNCGYMTMETAWVLLENCPDLTEIGNIYTWSEVITDEVQTFLNFIRYNNLSLTCLD